MVDGIKHTKPKTIANKFGKFYSQLGSNLAKSIVPGTTCTDQYVNNIPRQVDSMVIKPTTVHEINRIIRKLPNKTSHGHDEISNIMLKALCTSIIFPLCHIFNQSLYEGKFPEMMKWAEVIPLYKGKSMDLMVNYRPISLLIMLSKILEKIIHKRLYSYLDTRNVLYASQYGFHSKRSCQQAIAELMGYILHSKNKTEHSASVFLNLLKAFDMLDHQILLKKLHRYGIRGEAHDWFESYLAGRSLTAKITTSPNHIEKSERFDIAYGTAQGSCLGPLLFIIFVNDIHLLPLYSRIILFADDTTIFNSHTSSKYLQYDGT